MTGYFSDLSLNEPEQTRILKPKMGLSASIGKPSWIAICVSAIWMSLIKTLMTLPDLCLINYTLTDKKFIDYKLWWYEVKSSGNRESKYHTMKCKLYNCNKLFTYTNFRTKQITDRFHLSCDAISSVVLDQVYFLIESSTLWRELKLIILSCILVKIAKVLPFEQFQGQVGSFRMTHLVQKKTKDMWMWTQK